LLAAGRSGDQEDIVAAREELKGLDDASSA
jgi:hypothetical protein